MKSLSKLLEGFGRLDLVAGFIWLLVKGRPRRLTTEVISDQVIFFGYFLPGRGIQQYWGTVVERLRKRRPSMYFVVDDYKSIEISDSQVRLRSSQISIMIWLRAIGTYFGAINDDSLSLFSIIKSEFGHKQLAEQALFWNLLELSFPRNASFQETRKFVFLMEGLPWELTLAQFAQIRGVQIIGYPHTVVNMCQEPIRRSYFLAPQLAPDLIATSGNVVEAALEEIGFPKRSFRGVETTRFQIPTKRSYKKDVGAPLAGDKNYELVLSHLPERATAFASQLRTELNACSDVNIKLVFHPNMPVENRNQIRGSFKSLGFGVGTFTTGTKLVDALSSAWVNELSSTGFVNLWDPGMRCLSFVYRDPRRFGLSFRELSTGFLQLSFLSERQQILEKFLCFDEGTNRWMDLL